jgi:hypothetical protein
MSVSFAADVSIIHNKKKKKTKKNSGLSKSWRNLRRPKSREFDFISFQSMNKYIYSVLLLKIELEKMELEI